MPSILLFAALVSGAWTIDPAASKVQFTVTKKTSSVVEARFDDFRGDLVYDAEHPERSSVRWSVRVRSVRTGEPPRDRAVQTEEFLDAARFPELSFASSRVRRLPDGRLWMRGTMTIRGQHRTLTVVARPIADDPIRPVFETHFTLDRQAFGVASDSIARHAISREIRVHLVAVGRPR